MNIAAIALIETAMRRRARIESPADLLRYLLIAAGYMGVSYGLKKAFPDMNPKIRNFIAAMAVVVVAIIIITLTAGGGSDG